MLLCKLLLNTCTNILKVFQGRRHFRNSLTHDDHQPLAAMSYVEIILMAFPKKKILLGVNEPLRTQNAASSQLCICCRDFFTILHNEKGQERHGNYINGFSKKKILLRAIWSFGSQNGTFS